MARERECSLRWRRIRDKRKCLAWRSRPEAIPLPAPRRDERRALPLLLVFDLGCCEVVGVDVAVVAWFDLASLTGEVSLAALLVDVSAIIRLIGFLAPGTR